MSNSRKTPKQGTITQILSNIGKDLTEYSGRELSESDTTNNERLKRGDLDRESYESVHAPNFTLSRSPVNSSNPPPTQTTSTEENNVFRTPVGTITRSTLKQVKRSYSEGDESEFSVDAANQPDTALISSLLDCVQDIQTVRTKSSNLQGGYQKKLKIAEETIKEISSELACRKIGRDDGKLNRALVEENSKLKNHIKLLEKRISALEDSSRPKNKDEGSVSNSRSLPNQLEEIKTSLDKQMTEFKIEIKAMLTSCITNKTLAPATEINSSISNNAADKGRDNVNRPAETVQTKWSEVVGRKNRNKANDKKSQPPAQRTEAQVTGSNVQIAKKKNSVKITKDKEVIHIIREVGCKIEYAEIMKLARENINITDLGIEGVRPRTSLNGGLILEIPGKDMEKNADALAAKITELVKDKRIKVSRPQKWKEIIILGMDLSINVHDVIDAIKKQTGSDQEVKVGSIRRNLRGSSSVSVKCKKETALKLLAAGRMRMGWSDVKIIEADARPLQCYRCWEYGHLSGACKSQIDRSTWCYKCGNKEHIASECLETNMTCRLCEERKLAADHRMGSHACSTLRNFKEIDDLKRKNLSKNNPKPDVTSKKVAPPFLLAATTQPRTQPKPGTATSDASVKEKHDRDKSRANST
ncbi:uncharacterized protein LOC108629980 [Ceratina calcarata]|uniref:Uncharacterized protein LOC108629980 n=1 Tax=Ceratina calcarata TaxID=156304 RepID=A0AAJ7JAM7_9HYME|nr:uncharacterized protein LOC108629980 [Ceratina calcarata]